MHSTEQLTAKREVASFYLKLLPPALLAAYGRGTWPLLMTTVAAPLSVSVGGSTGRVVKSFRNRSPFPFQSPTELRWQLKTIASRAPL